MPVANPSVSSLGARPSEPASARVDRWFPYAVSAAVVAVLLALSGRYGYNVDELYFRLLGERGAAWGYTDQPPLVPLLVHAMSTLLGDTVWAIRIPAALCAGAVVLLGTALAGDLGGGRRATRLTAVGLGTSVLVLSDGHVMVTSTVDLVAWAAIALFAVRALTRDPRWWLAAGAVSGLALYAKYIAALLPISLMLALALAGPRRALADRRLHLGALLAIVVGAPNLIYQLTHDLPQLRMAEALGSTDGQLNRFIFLPSLLLLLGLFLTPIWAAGIVGLWRRPEWRELRALPLAFVLASAFTIVGGGRPDYVGGFLVPLFAAGCVCTERWLDRGRWRGPLLVSMLAVSTVMNAVIALPVLPARSLAVLPLNNVSLESVGWPELTEQVARVHRSLPEADRTRAVILAGNIGESGALDRYGDAYGLPAVFSGHNELHRFGPPPDSADVAVAIGVDPGVLARSFERCDERARVDNGLGVANAEQGVAISVCRGLRRPWPVLWPSYHYLSG